MAALATTAACLAALVLGVSARDQSRGDRVVETTRWDDGFPMGVISGTGTGIVAGHVLDDARGKPVASALVTIGAASDSIGRGDDERAYSRGLEELLNAQVQGLTSPRSTRLPALPLPRVLTDENGMFVFTDLPEGTYHIAVSKPGFVDGAFGRLRADGEVKPIVVKEGARVLDLRVWLSKQAAINGVVRDRLGDPVVGAPLRAYRRAIRAGHDVWTATTATATSDDRGMYRLSSLPPGDYLVGMVSMQVSAPVVLSGSTSTLIATVRPLGIGSFSLGTGGQHIGGNVGFVAQDVMGLPPVAATDATSAPLVYGPRFFPSVPDPAAARMVTVRAGDDYTGVDISIEAEPTGAISGRLTVAGNPAVTVAVHLTRQYDSIVTPEVDDAVAITNSDGEFLFPAVPAGQYRIHTAWTSWWKDVDRLDSVVAALPTAGPSGLYWIDTPVSVTPRETVPLQLALKPGVSISGRVTLDGGRPMLPPSLWKDVRVVAEPATGVWRASPPPQSSVISADGRFVIRDLLPGRYRVRATGVPPAFSFRGAAVGPPDTPDEIIEIAEDTNDVSVTVAESTTFLDGFVQSSDGRPDGDANVVAFPTNRAQWKDYGITTLSVRWQRTDNAGGFAIRGLPPGDYFVIAIPERSSQYATDPASLERLARFATQVRVEPRQPVSTRLLTHTLSFTPPATANSVGLGTATDVNDVLQNKAPHGPLVDVDSAAATQTRAAIKGVVREIDGTERPIRMARIAVRGSAIDHEWVTTSNAEGVFRLEGLPLGRYDVEVTKPAYLAQHYGATRPGRGFGALLVLDDAQPVREITIPLTRGAVIEGTVVDDLGAPLFQSVVRVLRLPSATTGATRAASQGNIVATVVADDRGMYRVYGLEPGRYIVAARPQPMTYTNTPVRQLTPADVRAALAGVSSRPALPNTSVQAQAVQYMPTYYPDTTFESEATPVVLTGGQEHRAVDIKIRLVVAASVEGRVVGRDGNGLGNAGISAVPANRSTALPAGFRANTLRDGRFSIAGLPPGRYTLAAMAYGQTGTPSWARATVDVNGVDISGLQLVVEEGVRVTGRVVLDTPTAATDLSGIRLTLEPADGIFLGFDQARTSRNGAFELIAPPGTYRLAVTPPANKEWIVDSATIAGVPDDVLDREFAIGPATRAVTVNITAKTAELSGIVVDDTGAPAPGYQMVLFSTDRSTWVAGHRRLVPPQVTASDGRYQFRQLLPGEYYVAAISGIADVDPVDLLILESIATSASRVKIGAGEKRTVDLKVKR